MSDSRACAVCVLSDALHRIAAITHVEGTLLCLSHARQLVGRPPGQSHVEFLASCVK